MDRWKRISNGVLLNDDATGYHNARKRVERRNAKANEMQELRDRIGKIESGLQNFGAGAAFAGELADIKERISRLERGLESTDKTMQMLVELCKTLHKALKMM